MRIPAELEAAVEKELEQVPPGALSRAASQLTERYKAGDFRGTLSTAEARAAYLAVRLPATYAANRRVFTEMQRIAADFAPRTLLDLGSGPGTAAWAATEGFPSVERVTLVERDPTLITLGRRLASSSSREALLRATWTQSDLASNPPFPPHDLVVLSYAVGEFSNSDAKSLIHRAWSAATEALVLIEPGTPKAFARVDILRSQLIAAGAHLLAPCPHHEVCPMAAAGDWCHFSQRLERSSLHRRLKQGTLGYEDEKFSYTVATKRDLERAASRIVRHPAKNPGHVQLTLCASGGIRMATVGKSQKQRYRAARQSEWGDPWE